MNFAQPFADYELLDRVGAGAMGTVFKARQKKLQRIVALKVLKPSLARDARYVDRLRREARIVASLSHPNIVAGIDLGEAGGYHFFVMEFVEGKSLRQLLVEWGMFAEEYVLKVGQQVGEALDHAFERGVIHRDIKPGNILIDDQGNVKLSDMGLAKGPADLTLTRDGATVGTPQYISPEQARNPHDVDVRTDLYSLGGTLYHMATGQPPFRGDTMAELITKVLHDVPVPPDELNPALSSGMSLVIRKLLAKDLKVRYQTPRELLDDLDRLRRSQPVKVDASALSAQETKTAGALVRSLATVLIVVVLAAAVWVGRQFSARAPDGPGPEVYLAELDVALRALPTPGARLEHLRGVMVAPKAGAEIGLLQREKAAVADLRGSVDKVAGEMLEAGWKALVAWLHDPVVWPDIERWERERLAAVLRQRCGITVAELPSNVALRRLDELRTSVAGLLRERDQDLLRRFEEHLGVTVPARVDERVRAGDFATAARLWNDALTDYFDGVRQPLPGRLSEGLVQKLRDRHRIAESQAAPALASAEAAVADALRGEVTEVCRAFDERLSGATDPDLVEAELLRYDKELQQTWPASSRFRVDRDPWPHIERQLQELRLRIAMEQAVAADHRLDRLLDLAWRSFAHGTAADGQAVLAALPKVGTARQAKVAGHQRAMAAAWRVAAGVLQALARQGRSMAVFPRVGGGPAVELRAEHGDGVAVLWREAIGHAPRRANLTDFRLVDLLGRMEQESLDPLAGIDAEERAVGVMVFAMLGDELAGIGPRLKQLGDTFLLEEVWPRLDRVRKELPEEWLDRTAVFTRLAKALDAAQQSGRFVDVEAALLVCENRVAREDLLNTESQLLRQAKDWLRGERRRRDVYSQLQASAPRGAEIVVASRAGELQAEVVLPVAVMHRDSAEGWQVRDELLEFSSGQRPWSEIHLQQLRCPTGLDTNVRLLRADFDLLLPTAAVGLRTYVFEFRGIAVLLTLGADDRVYVVLVDGDPRREELTQRAFQRAMQLALERPRIVAVPRAQHRLSIELSLSRSGTRANVRVHFEGTQVLEAGRDMDPRTPVSVAVLPQQEIALQRVLVHAAGL